MVEEQTPPPRRTLGDYVMNRGPRHFSSIAIPTTTKVLEIKPAFLTLISTHQFKQWIMRIHMHICLHFMNWWEQWASI